MVTVVINKIIQRDLLKLKSEIELYKDESNLWKVEKKLPIRLAIFVFIWWGI